MQLFREQENKYLKIEDYIDKANNILLATHQSPDGDAIGSLCAMMDYLSLKNKKYIAFSEDDISPNFLFLRNAHRIISDKAKLARENFDLAIILDCSSLGYTNIGNYMQERKNGGDKIDLITIDHHSGNQGYGDFNLVDGRAASTTVLLSKLFEVTGIEIKKETATAMLLGILADTGGFTNKATNSEAMEITSRLIGRSGKYNYIIRQIFQDKDEQSLKIWSKVLSRLIKNDKLNIAYSVVLADDIMQDNRASVDGISNFFNNLGDVSMSMVLKEQEGNKIKVSLRGIKEGTNVLRLARFFQGGGHVKSAGFMINGRLEKVGRYWQVV
ncbi:MAG: DHH family phosphoesterase [Candidatus Kuenenbacteria bacterium]